jgi:1-aminocyclopropane-1-carboxylate synthase
MIMQAPALVRVLRWARKHGVHVVSDEIYANSVYDGEAQGQAFTSLAAVAASEAPVDMAADPTGGGAHRGGLGSDVHIIWGFSKDFCASGFRVGALMTENTQVHDAMRPLGYMGCVSSQTQGTLTSVLRDAEWTSGYMQRNRARLAAASSTVCGILNRIGLPFIKPAAALFVFIDMRQLLGHQKAEEASPLGAPQPAEPSRLPGWEQEHALFLTIAHECNVLFTPGHDCCMSAPGWFRCCFTSVDSAQLEDGFERIAKYFGLPRVSL